MEFNQGASIFTRDNREIGRIERVVIHRKTKLVTHLVVRKGFLFTEDKVVPVQVVTNGQKDRITLRVCTDRLEQLPNYQKTHYIRLTEEELKHEAEDPRRGTAPVSYWYPPYGEPILGPRNQLPYVAATETHIPAGTVALKEGAQVTARDGTHIGSVEQVLTGPTSNCATHFLVSKGLVLKEKKMVPVEWIDTFAEDQVRLTVGSKVIETLPDYEHAEAR